MTIRKQRLTAARDLAVQAEQLAQTAKNVAEHLTQTIQDLDRLAPNGVRRANLDKKFAPYEEVVAQADAYGQLLPPPIKDSADRHLTAATDHDPETCVLCAPKRKGWLTDHYAKLIARMVRDMVREGDLRIFEEQAERVIREDERRQLRESGRLLPSSMPIKSPSRPSPPKPPPTDG